MLVLLLQYGMDLCYVKIQVNLSIFHALSGSKPTREKAGG